MIIDWSDLEGYVDKLDARGETIIASRFHTAVDKAGIEVQRAALANLARASAGRGKQFNRTGKLRQAVAAGVEGRGVGLGRQVSIGAPISYAAPVEFGSAYGSKVPPRSRLALWAKRKLGLSKRDAEVWGFQMQQRVRKEGVKPHPFMFPALDDSMDPIDRIFAHEHSAAVAALAAL